jgi:TolA-binding protein
VRLSCLRVARLLAASAAGLSPADALRLEEHLDSCPTCRGDAAALERMRRLTEPERALSERMRGRAIHSALRRAGERAAQSPARSRRAAPWFLGAAAAAAAFSLLLQGGKWGDPDEKPEPPNGEGAGVPTHVAAAALQDSPGPVRAAPQAQGDAISGRVTLTVAQKKVEVVAEAGSRVVVDGRRVRVVAGSVVVVAAAGKKVDRQVAAGGSWELSTPRPADKVDVSALIDSATRHLAADEVEAARADLKVVIATRPGRARVAEAEGLLAQATLMEGDVGGAVGAYLGVAERYGDLAVGERARFQAAKVEANFGGKARARELLQDYLRRYPDGRFRGEAERRLQRLD